MEKIIIAGFGGQGVLSLGQFIAYAALYENKAVTWLPSYGPEMRGGTANCSVVVDDTEVASPIIAVPDTLIAMNKPSLDKFKNKVRPGGLIIVNSSLISDKVERTDVTTIYVRKRTRARSGQRQDGEYRCSGRIYEVQQTLPEGSNAQHHRKGFPRKTQGNPRQPESV